MLGGAQQESITLSWTVNSLDMAVIEEQLHEGKTRGYSNFNVKVGSPQTPEYDLELVRKVRAFALDGFLWADANTGYSLETALDILPKLADAGVQVIESPLPPHQIRGYQTLKRQGALPVLMDEGILSPDEAAEFIALDMIDGITMKPARCAGLWYSQKIIRLANEQDMMVLGSGLTDPDLSLAAALHLYAWAGINQPCALNGPQYLVESLCDSDFKPNKDVFAVPSKPGLGIGMDECAEDFLNLAVEK
jgi:L-alanine-DL-glutamate epimerase-like enolase superfamily enzyme